MTVLVNFTVIKEGLSAIKDSFFSKRDGCPFCEDSDGGDKKFIPPYKLNVWLDLLAKEISGELLGPVKVGRILFLGMRKIIILLIRHKVMMKMTSIKDKREKYVL